MTIAFAAGGSEAEFQMTNLIEACLIPGRLFFVGVS
jgi:hypothetical protein